MTRVHLLYLFVYVIAICSIISEDTLMVELLRTISLALIRLQVKAYIPWQISTWATLLRARHYYMI